PRGYPLIPSVAKNAICFTCRFYHAEKFMSRQRKEGLWLSLFSLPALGKFCRFLVKIMGMPSAFQGLLSLAVDAAINSPFLVHTLEHMLQLLLGGADAS